MNKDYISVLYETIPPKKEFIRNLEPDYFLDLNLDQVVNAIMSERAYHNLQPYFYLLPDDEETILYRQEVLKDFSSASLLTGILEFSNNIKNAKEYKNYSELSEHLFQKQRWYIDFVTAYCNAIRILHHQLNSVPIVSKGLNKIKNHLDNVIKNNTFLFAEQESNRIREAFFSLRYGLILEQDKVIISINPSVEDYCKKLNDTFIKTVPIDPMKNPFSNALVLSTLELEILRVLSIEIPKPFDDLRIFYEKSKDIVDESILLFEKEIQFYTSFCLYRNQLEHLGFHFSYPVFTKDKLAIMDGYDLALANKNASSHKPVIFNHATFTKEERFLVITGPNQGGKTTFARAMGQIIYFSKIGLMAPCSSVALPFFSGITTHFSEEESPDSGRGKLKEELIRLRDIRRKNISHHFVIMNELFTTAATYDSLLMGEKVLDYFILSNCYGVYVTHIKELAQNNKKTASYVALLDQSDHRTRTYKIVKRSPEGIGYAESIVQKYGMTYEMMKEVLKRNSVLK